MRPLLALLPLWLAFAIADPGVLHSCPMHGGVPAAQQSHGAAHGAAHGHHQAPQAPEHHHGACTCIGACTPSATAYAPSTPATGIVAVVVTFDALLPEATRDHVSADSQYRLPFSNGPPTLG